MHLSWLLLLSTVCVGYAGVISRAIWQFAEMIQCAQPGINPLIYNEYGCFCGLGGSGSPKDQLDQCCVVHDNCYSNAKNLPECPGIADLPYVKDYAFTCSNKRVTCSATNDKCQATVCECDRVAAHCFAQYNHVYNPDYKYLDSSQCK